MVNLNKRISTLLPTLQEMQMDINHRNNRLLMVVVGVVFQGGIQDIDLIALFGDGGRWNVLPAQHQFNEEPDDNNEVI